MWEPGPPAHPRCAHENGTVRCPFPRGITAPGIIQEIFSVATVKYLAFPSCRHDRSEASNPADNPVRTRLRD